MASVDGSLALVWDAKWLMIICHASKDVLQPRTCPKINSKIDKRIQERSKLSCLDQSIKIGFILPEYSSEEDRNFGGRGGSISMNFRIDSHKSHIEFADAKIEK